MVTMLVTLCTGIASLGLYTYFIPLLDGLGLSSAHVWLIWVWGIGGAIGALFVGRVVDAAQRSTAVTALITALLLLALGDAGVGVTRPSAAHPYGGQSP